MPPDPPKTFTNGVTGVRIRSHDQITDTNLLKKRLKACRKTIEISETIFRCDRQGEHETSPMGLIHQESGIVKKPKAPDVHYHIEWFEISPVRFRNATERTTTRK